jgi:2-succinyl-5-enolpyruvyl-6-hydroxy-3-cyclohexene-1-carboxylate synthase
MNNLDLANAVIDLAISAGAAQFVVCGGSRNSPLVVALAGRVGYDLVSYPDERAAAFFALGRARRDGRPVAVVTTSGTAVAELLPAAIEAFYSGVPLILITADRPRRYRRTGAPQAIEQMGIFGPYAPAAIDAESIADLAAPLWDRRSPLHVNVAFDEPLLGSAPLSSSANTFEIGVPAQSGDLPALKQFLDDASRPLLLIGGLQREERAAVERFALALGAPVYAEPLSGLRESPSLEQLLVRSGERVLARGGFDAVLRLGSVPALRFWRDLDESLPDIPVLSVSSLPFSGLSRGTHVQAALGELPIPSAKPAPAFHELDRSMASRLGDLMERFPRSEVSMIRGLSLLVPPRSSVFLGNSLPIREWDLGAARTPNGFEYGGNRGANGIDGAISTFLGSVSPARENWCVIGDLTALYDLSAPWVLPQLDPSAVIRIVIVNNGGGRIFSRVPSLRMIDAPQRERLFENSHELRFEHWAAMWNLHYEAWTDIAARARSDSPAVIELLPDAGQTGDFWAEYDRTWEQR